MKYLGIDYGEKRIGFAGSDSGILASPLEILHVKNPKEQIVLVANIITKHQPEIIVIGLPVHADGREGPESTRVKEFAKKIERIFPDLKIVFTNEHLTSVAAQERGNSRSFIDDEAARIILEQYFTETTR